MAGSKEILIYTNSDRLFKFLRQYLNLGFSIFFNETQYQVDVLYLNDSLYPRVQQIYQYPIFSFYLTEEFEYAHQLLDQLEHKQMAVTNPTKEPVGTLEIIDLQSDQCILKYSYEDVIFQEIDKKIFDEISKLWKFEIKNEINETAKPKKTITDNPAQLGKFIKTINFPSKEEHEEPSINSIESKGSLIQDNTTQKYVPSIESNSIESNGSLIHDNTLQIYVPSTEATFVKWKRAYKLIVQMDKEYKKDCEDGKISVAHPSLDDYRDRLEDKMKWKPSQKTVERIRKAGKGGLLK